MIPLHFRDQEKSYQALSFALAVQRAHVFE
jgi:hypothetical protein